MTGIIETIGLIGSLASIFSFNPEVIRSFFNQDKFRDEKTKIEFLRYLSQTSKGWKEVHIAYHGMQRDILKVTDETSYYDNKGNRVEKNSDQIGPGTLRPMFTTTTIWNYANTHEARIGAFLRTVRRDRNEFPVRSQEIARKDRLLGEYIEGYIANMSNFLQFNDDFSAYIDGLKAMEPRRWTNVHVEYILDHFTLYSGDYFTHLATIDNILINVLSIFEVVIAMDTQGDG